MLCAWLVEPISRVITTAAQIRAGAGVITKHLAGLLVVVPGLALWAARAGAGCIANRVIV
jgi:hypothetical protein